MTDETAKALAEAMIRLAAAIEKLNSSGMMPGGIHVWHHGAQPQQPNIPFPPPWNVTCNTR